MKKCSKCNIEKSLDNYYFKDKKIGRLHAQCKACYKEHRTSYSAIHYQKYRDSYRERAKIRRIKIKKELQTQMLIYLKNKSCALCSEDDIRVLEFDHLDPLQKSFSISKGITDGMPWDKILSEIKKCRILCANCHKRHTATQFGWYKSITD